MTDSKKNTATQSNNSSTPKQYDLVLFGATSFVGQITASYLAKHFQDCSNDNQVTWAIAGRSESKLASITTQLNLGNVHKIIANAKNSEQINNMVKQAKVIISTVGPYDLYGEALVKSCAENGVHYCDLAGETHWIKRMVDNYGATALKNGSCIVHCCGFDSIPSDLGVHFLQNAAQQQFQQPCTQIDLRIKGMRGTLSGGTVASMINQIKLAKDDARLQKSLKNPYQICPSHTEQQKTRQKNIIKPVYEDAYQSWTGPFIMAAVNTKIVHRSNALADYAYTPSFKYNEAQLMGDGRTGYLKAMAMTGAVAGLMVGSSFKKSRDLLEKHILPKPGQGPSKKQQEKGFFNFMFYGKTANGDTLKAKVTGDRDPGYGSTAKMLAQSGLCLLKDLPENQAGGFWTPASLMGDKLITRLENHAGLTFSIIS